MGDFSMKTPVAVPCRVTSSYGFTLLIPLIATIVCTATASVEDYSAWTYCGSVFLNTTASGADVSNNIIDFPVLVNLIGNNFPFDQAKGSGEDIRFSKTDGTHLSFQIEQWDSSGAAAAVWVRVDTVYGNNSSQKILMYWGKSDAVDSSNGEAVFDTSDSFRGVWHLKDGNDATYRNNDGTNNGVSIVDAAIGQGGDFENSETDNLDLGTNIAGSGETELTLSFWFKAESFSGLRSVFNADGWNSGDLHYQFNGDQLEFTVNGFNAEKCKDAFSTGQWYHVATTWEKTSKDINWYVNGTFVDNDVASASVDADLSTEYVIGAWWDGAFSRTFDGILDELRLSNTVRSADWIKLSYENQKQGQTMVTVNTPFLPLTGSTMRGGIVMGGKDLEGIDSMSAKTVELGRLRISDWSIDVPDYVFDEGYELPSMAQVEEYVLEHCHLPGVPDAARLESEGMDLGDMHLMLLKHIEQINLHLIAQEKRIHNLKSKLMQGTCQ
jgi:hypothetical protein